MIRILVPRTARYVIRNQAETAEDAESTSEHLRIQQYAIFLFNFWRRKGCTVWYALKLILNEWSARYVIRNQPHDVLHRSHMTWYVYQERPGMWYEITHMMFFTRKQNAREWKKTDVRASWCCACGLAWVVTAAAGTTRRRPHYIRVLLYGYENITRKVKKVFMVILIPKPSLN